MKKVILITGGQRSGKSVQAEKMALSMSDHPVYMATAHIWDEEFRQRVAVHQQRRGPQWTNIEEERYLSSYDVSGRVVLIDCITLWLTNLFFEHQDANAALQTAQKEFDRLTEQDATFIFVTNEIGLGGVSDNQVQRRFTDLQGRFNQYVAERAQQVIMMISGIPMTIKNQ